MNYERRDLIKAMVLKAYVRAGQEDKKDRMRILIDDLMGSGLDTSVINRSLEIHARISSFAPTLADIMKPVKQHFESLVSDEVDARWVYFLNNGLNRDKKVDTWADEVQKLLGKYRCFDAKTSEIPFIKREFYDIVQRQIQKDPKVICDGNWKMISGEWCLLPYSNPGNEIPFSFALTDGEFGKKIQEFKAEINSIIENFGLDFEDGVVDLWVDAYYADDAILVERWYEDPSTAEIVVYAAVAQLLEDSDDDDCAYLWDSEENCFEKYVFVDENKIARAA